MDSATVTAIYTGDNILKKKKKSGLVVHIYSREAETQGPWGSLTDLTNSDQWESLS